MSCMDIPAVNLSQRVLWRMIETIDRSITVTVLADIVIVALKCFRFYT